MDDVEARMGTTFNDTDRQMISTGVLDISALIDLEAAWTDGIRPDPLPYLFRMISAQAVIRWFRNPEGFRSEMAGEYQYQYGGAGATLGKPTLTPEEKQQIARYLGRDGITSVSAGADFDACERAQIVPAFRSRTYWG
ncbi:hypothetical protein [Streptomyces sp. B1I3]|uniref:hypothetical protein n=1 Tax=Streptomyces sp. B1I3 TaxID=3042264 RepID=UPI0027D887A2|nr:hypothetical protein [Streptomyces sp. B1I3]